MSEIVQFNYFHRNSGNWKKFGSKLYSNPENLTIEQINQMILQNLIDGLYFYPEKVGIKRFKFHRFCDNYSWYEFESAEVIRSFQKKKPIRSINKLCSLLEKMNNSDVYVLGDQPSTCPICGLRTNICNESIHFQLHHCPSKNCGFVFLTEENEQ